MEQMPEFVNTISRFISNFYNVVTHLDFFLGLGAAFLGPKLYFLLFAVIFCETGLIVTPFLPGDSLLFALGALCASPNSVISFPLMGATLCCAAILGDITNYCVGRFVGPRIFKVEKSFWFNPQHLQRTKGFYEKYGRKTIVMARFIPIVRTFAPFVAGIGHMRFREFIGFSIAGGLFWIWAFMGLGYFFGNLPGVKTNFHLVILAIIIISVVPIVVEFLKHRKLRKINS